MEELSQCSHTLEAKRRKGFLKGGGGGLPSPSPPDGERKKVFKGSDQEIASTGKLNEGKI